MADAGEKRHVHHGRSSRGILDPKAILDKVGLKIGDTFLDIGAGEGHFSLAAAVLVGGAGRVYALDIDGEAVDRLSKLVAEKEIPNIETICADAADKIPLSDESIDVVLMANVLHGFVANDEAERVMMEATRIIRHDGRLVVVEFKKEESQMGPPLSIRLSPEDVLRLMANYGFRGDRVIDLRPHHYEAILSRE